MKSWLLNHGRIKWKQLFVSLTENDLFRIMQGYPLEVGFYTDDNHDPTSSPMFKVLIQKNLDKKFLNFDSDTLTDMYKADEKDSELIDQVKNKLQSLLTLINDGGEVEKKPEPILKEVL